MSTRDDMYIERLEAQLAEASRRITELEGRLTHDRANCENHTRIGVRCVAERERLLWLACLTVLDSDWQSDVARLAERILAEHGYDRARILRVADFAEPVVPK